MRTPQFILTYRLVTVVIAVIIILLFALGTAGVWPLADLVGPSAPKIGI
jgi:hypothetical protein